MAVEYKLADLLSYLKANGENAGENTIEVFEQKTGFVKTYKELYTDVVKTVGYLKSRQLKKRDRIGLFGKNSYEWIVIDLACLVGGWVSVSFHEKNFTGDLTTIHRDFNLQLLFIEDEYAEREWDAPAETIRSLPDKIKDILPEAVKPGAFGADEVFTVIFTSGTTGAPKALRIKIKGIENFLNGLNTCLGLNKKDKIVIFLPLSVLTCKAYIYGAILYGFNIALCAVDNLIKVLLLSKPTILQGVPYLFETVYNTFFIKLKIFPVKYLVVKFFFTVKRFLPQKLMIQLRDAMFKEFTKNWGGNMRLMVTGAAPISPKVLKFYQDVGLPLYEAYATNEIGLITLNYPGKNRVGSVGTPFMDNKIKLDENSQILVYDNSLADGYEGSTGEMEKRIFREDGYIATGDIGYFDKDNFLYIKGRMNDVINLANGEKVYPNAIENRLKGNPLVKQAVVLGNNKPFLVCIIVGAGDDIAHAQLEKIVHDANKHLNEHSVIKGFIAAKKPFTIENKQLNVNLKLNRREIYKAYEKEIDKLYG